MGLVYSVRVVSLLEPYLGGRASTAEAVARSERTALRQNIVNSTTAGYLGTVFLLGATDVTNWFRALFILTDDGLATYAHLGQFNLGL